MELSIVRAIIAVAIGVANAGDLRTVESEFPSIADYDSIAIQKTIAMTKSQAQRTITVGVLALQGAFHEHLQLLRQAATIIRSKTNADNTIWQFFEVRTPEELSRCDALIIPGGESTTMSLVAARSNLLDPLRDFVKLHRKPTWGTCAGLILLAESANRIKKGGQDLVGGLDVRVNRNHFGRQVESFETKLDLPFLNSPNGKTTDVGQPPFNAVFIRAPVVERLLPTRPGEQVEEAKKEDTVVAPSRASENGAVSRTAGAKVEVMATLPGRHAALADKVAAEQLDRNAGDIVVVKQGNVFGTSFHPELTGDSRIHVWWLEQVKADLETK